MKLLNLFSSLVLFSICFYGHAQSTVSEEERVKLRTLSMYRGYIEYNRSIVDTFSWEKYRLVYMRDTLDEDFDGLNVRFNRYEKINRLPSDAVLMKTKALVARSDRSSDSLLFSMIRKMKNLKVLILEYSDYPKIDESIFELKQLKILSVANNYITEIPKKITTLENLQVLNLQFNKLQGDWAILGALANLKILLLNSNKLETFPPSITKLKGLEVLNLDFNDIVSIPDQIDEMYFLKKLSLDKNELTETPTSLFKLSELMSLNLGRNHLTTLPENMEKASNLRHLDVYDNRIDILPPSIGSIPHLKTLNASGNLLQTVPETITRLVELENLSLSANQIKVLPIYLNRLKNLQVLDLSANKINSTGTALDSLSKLVELHIGNNPNLIISSKTSTWTSLKKLDLSNCNLIQVPSGISEIKKLWKLNLSKNKGLILSSFLKELVNLGELDLIANDMKTIPAFLFFMPALKLINLQNNQITYLPKEYPYRKGPQLDIRGNPISEQPDELLKLSTWEQYICIAPELYFAQKRYEKALEVATSILAKKGQNPYYDDDRCIDPKNHIRYAMYAQDAQQTIDLATRFLTWHSTETYINARLIIGYILNKQFSEAEKLILEWKGKKFSNGKDAHGYILNEILLMEQNGIQHVDFARAKQLLK